MTLKESMPYEFMRGEFDNCKAFNFKDIEVKEEHSSFSLGTFHNKWIRWPGKEKNVHLWVELVNGYVVGFNENPARGWSFPVIKIK